jgi:hypothetical protein
MVISPVLASMAKAPVGGYETYLPPLFTAGQSGELHFYRLALDNSLMMDFYLSGIYEFNLLIVEPMAHPS